MEVLVALVLLAVGTALVVGPAVRTFGSGDVAEVGGLKEALTGTEQDQSDPALRRESTEQVSSLIARIRELEAAAQELHQNAVRELDLAQERLRS